MAWFRLTKCWENSAFKDVRSGDSHSQISKMAIGSLTKQKSQQNMDLGPRELLIKNQIIFKGKLYFTFMKKLFTLLFKLHKLLQWSYSVSGCFFGTVPWLSVSKAVAMHCSSWIWKPSNSYSTAVEKNPKNSQTCLISKDTSDPGNVF